MSKEALAEQEVVEESTETGEADAANEQSLDDASSILASPEDWEPSPDDRGDFVPEPEPQIAPDEQVLEQEVAEQATIAQPESVDEPEKPHMIPKTRLDSQIRKTRELEEAKIRMEEQMKFLQAQIDAGKPQEAAPEAAPVQEEYDFAGQYKLMQELTLDGEADKAASVFQDILSHQSNSMEQRFNQQITQTYEQNRTQETIQADLAAAANEIVVDYPELNIQDKDAFNAELTGEINELMGALTTVQKADGMPKYTPAQALRQAVAMKMPRKETAPEPVGTNSTNGTGNIKKKVAAANSQPPSLPGDRGTSHGKTPVIDPENMTEEDFDALPASTIARLRGDI
jgi:hypothetical protein